MTENRQSVKNGWYGVSNKKIKLRGKAIKQSCKASTISVRTYVEKKTTQTYKRSSRRSYIKPLFPQQFIFSSMYLVF